MRHGLHPMHSLTSILCAERGPEDKAGEELQPSPEADGEAAAEDAEGVEDDDADLEGALESVAEGMQALNVDDEVISQVILNSRCSRLGPTA